MSVPVEEQPQPPGGCGFRACLTAAMVLFSVLLVVMLYLVFSRVGAQP
ncbi:hypothetical protein BH23GEM3_BH23GEM3_16530 [soil metagenome]